MKSSSQPQGLAMRELKLTITPAFEGNVEIHVPDLDTDPAVLHCSKRPPGYNVVNDPRFDKERGELRWTISLDREQLRSVRSLLLTALQSCCPDEIGLDGVGLCLSVRSESGTREFGWWAHDGSCSAFDELARRLAAFAGPRASY